ncbi:MAG TPA: hypothetical protein VI819_04255 [Patescibacteria group bacterium]|nr:hypothetical protein [Patescibacteria group bacterium]
MSKETNPIGRKNAIKIILYGGAITYVVSDMVNKFIDMVNVINFRNVAEASVKATDITRPVGTIPEMLLIPEKIIETAGVLDLITNDTLIGFGSTTLMEVDKITNIGMCLSAKHVIKELKHAEHINIFQPHLNRKLIEIPKNEFVTASHNKKDIGVLAFRLNNILQDTKLPVIPIKDNWTPNSHDLLYSLAFAGSAEKHDRINPLKFNLSENIYAKDYDGNLCYKTTMNSGGGSSGAAVVTEDGGIIGVITSIDLDTGLELVTPIVDEYHQLAEDAKRKLLKT